MFTPIALTPPPSRPHWEADPVARGRQIARRGKGACTWLLDATEDQRHGSNFREFGQRYHCGTPGRSQDMPPDNVLGVFSTDSQNFISIPSIEEAVMKFWESSGEMCSCGWFDHNSVFMTRCKHTLLTSSSTKTNQTYPLSTHSWLGYMRALKMNLAACIVHHVPPHILMPRSSCVFMTYFNDSAPCWVCITKRTISSGGDKFIVGVPKLS